MSFTAERVTMSQTIQLAASPNRIFPLFEPIGEKAWAEGWDPQMLFPADGTAQKGAVFTTSHPAGGESIWTMIAYDPTTLHLAYQRVTPGIHVVFIEIQCEEVQDGTTRATVTYTLTGLSAAGNEHLAHLKAHHQRDVASWEQAINYYLAHGQTLRQH
jgi:hypothetical protein